MSDREMLKALLDVRPIRRKLATGSQAVELPGFKVFCPKPMAGGHPVISWGNPSWFDSWTFSGLLSQLAGDGVVVVASHDTTVGDGASILDGIELMAEENRKPGGQFYGRLDMERVGVLGHSQGGGGSLRAWQDSRVGAIVALCPYGGTAAGLAPRFIVAGERDSVCRPASVQKTCVDRCRAETVYAVLKGAGHLTPVTALGGSKTLNSRVREWFKWKLFAGDGSAFRSIQADAAWSVKRFD